MRARYPADPFLAWVAYPSNAIIRGRRFHTWREAYSYAYRRAHR